MTQSTPAAVQVELVERTPHARTLPFRNAVRLKTTTYMTLTQPPKQLTILEELKMRTSTEETPFQPWLLV